MTENISAILFWANILSEARYVRTLFQSCIISFYIAFRVGFETQLMKTTKYIRTVSK